MFFNSWPFIYLLLLTFFLYHGPLAKSIILRQILLLTASYTFYGWWDPRFLSLIIISTMIDFLVSMKIGGIREAGGNQAATKPWVTLSVVMNLTMLGFFKYFNFFADNFERITGLFGMEPNWITLNIVLPVGISFYTFQSMAYTIDVYRGKADVCKNFITFAVYVSFFPQLVAGPIERAQHLIPQFIKPSPLTRDRIQMGICLLILGFFKKVAIADPLAPKVTEVLADPSAFSGQRLVMTIYLFTFQLYADFSSYSDIARGAARLFGIDLIRNFEQPFFSTSVGEFWRRWHISLMSWFRDYLFIPLGGSRVSERRVYINIMVVMALSGLWHGAGWNWPLWGALNGVYLWAERYAAKRREAQGIVSPPLTKRESFFRAIYVYHLFCIGAVVFLNGDIGNFSSYVRGMLVGWKPWTMAELILLLWLGIYVAITVFMDVMQRRTGYHEFPMFMTSWKGGLVMGLMMVAIIYWSVSESVPYFYFQF